MIFFVHIPKTAGTSFRLGAERFYKKRKMRYDYGVGSDETSSEIHQYVYNNKGDFWGLKKKLSKNKISMLAGHVQLNRFVGISGVMNTVTFVRDPIQRMMSEYRHFVRHNGYQGDFESFYTRDVMRNRMSKILHGVDVEAMGLVGLTERYGESLRIFNSCYKSKVLLQEKNLGKGALDEPYQIEVSDHKKLININKKDVALFDHCQRLFDIRYKLFLASLPYAHAKVQEASGKQVRGWAWWSGEDDSAVEIELLVNDAVHGQTMAIKMRPSLLRLGPPRGGYVGFDFPCDLASGDTVQCRVVKTGQLFPPEPVEIS